MGRRVLCGYVGIDLVLGDKSTGFRNAVIEINPRVTTSYIGLRRLATFNIMEALLALASGEQVRVPEWNFRSGGVHFRGDGTIVDDSGGIT